MCGILGYIGAVSNNKFVDALNLQEHRGPDAWDYVDLGGVHFGHRRLSIIDLHEHSRQPMVAGNGDLTCIFNGEIYNFQEIRADLEIKGYQFKTKSDTEVLINAYHCYGPAAIDLFIGMFAFAIYDRRDKSIFIARDRLGIKPLFFSKLNSGDICFSSEIKSIKKLSGHSFNLNLNAIGAYLSFRYPLTEETFFEGVEQLAPGHYIRIDSDRTITCKRYWSFSDKLEQQHEDKGEEYYLDEFKRLFHSAVKYRMIADVPVGAYLSGGVDSSAVVAEMSSLTSRPVQTFTIGFENEGYNEFEYARMVSDRYKTEHHEIILSQGDYFESMEELIRLKDAPLGVPNEVPLYKMSKELRKFVTVVLSGEGADEIFGGYGRLFRSADDWEKLLTFKANPNKCSEELKASLYKRYGKDAPSSQIEHFLGLYRYTPLDTQRALLHKRFQSDHLITKSEHLFNKAFSEVENADYASKMMYAFEKLHLPGLLQRVDTTTMGASVEARVPFVDHRLVEFAFTVPNKYKMKWKGEIPQAGLLGSDISEIYDTPKYLVKKAFEDRLPHDVLYRKKMGFPVPLNNWFGAEFNQSVLDRILTGNLRKMEIIDHHWVERMFKPSRDKNNTNGVLLWMLLNVEIFTNYI